MTHFANVSGLSWHVGFPLFILALRQDYNIYLVARIHEELRHATLQRTVATAGTRTGRAVSSCGLIMAAAFASMCFGSLLVMKEFAIALAMGILIDTFVIRPLLVPSALLLVLNFATDGVGARRCHPTLARSTAATSAAGRAKDQRRVGPALP